MSRLRLFYILSMALGCSSALWASSSLDSPLVEQDGEEARLSMGQYPNDRQENFNIIQEILSSSHKKDSKAKDFLKKLNIEPGDDVIGHLNAIEAENLEDWYSLANAVRHNAPNRYWPVFFYKTLLSFPGISNSMKSRLYRGLAKIEAREHKLNEALELTKKAIDVDPDCVANYLWLGHNPHIGPRLQQDYLLKAYRLAAKSNNKISQAQACIGLGNIRYTDDSHQQNTADLSINEGDKELRAQAHIGLGNAFSTPEYRSKQALQYLAARKLLGDYGNEILKAQAYIGLGNTHYSDKGHERKDWYLNALDCLGTEGYEDLKAQAYIGLGNARYVDADHYSNSEWYWEVIDRLGTDGNKTLRTKAYIGIGNAYGAVRKNENAVKYYQKAMDLNASEDLYQKAKKAMESCQGILNRTVNTDNWRSKPENEDKWRSKNFQ